MKTLQEVIKQYEKEYAEQVKKAGESNSVTAWTMGSLWRLEQVIKDLKQVEEVI